LGLFVFNLRVGISCITDSTAQAYVGELQVWYISAS